MITLYLPSSNNSYDVLKERLDALPVKHEVVKTDSGDEPRLADKNQEIAGRASIEDYLSELEEFAEAWYEDRCDKYDFDPDASRIPEPGKIKPRYINIDGQKKSLYPFLPVYAPQSRSRQVEMIG